MTFTRAAVGASRVKDETARIRVYISRADAATAGKENITRSLVVESAKVSEVEQAIVDALFGAPAKAPKSDKKAA